jgi:arylsulfatase A-like enzyme
VNPPRLKVNKHFTCIVVSLIVFGFFSYPQDKLEAKEKSSIEPPDYNVVLIVVDCLRPDHLSSYGYSRKITPNIDALAKSGILFEKAIAPATQTLLSFSSIFASQHVPTHGVNGFDKYLDDTAVTLAEVLQKYGYRTAAFCGGPLLNPIYQLDQGFDTYHHLNTVFSHFKDHIPVALEWIQERKKKKEKFFVFLHGNDLHGSKWQPPKVMFGNDYSKKTNIPLLLSASWNIPSHEKIIKGKKLISPTDEDIKYLIDRYDTLLKNADRLIGDFLRKLKKLKLLDNTIIVLTADHGEGLFDHNWYAHGMELYETTIHVPLIIKIPHFKKRNIKIPYPVSLIDLTPTIIELTGGVVNKGATGHSLLPLITQKTHPRFNQYIFSQTSATFGGITIRTGKWKLIYFPEKIELYNLAVDPNEKSNLVKKEPKIALDLMKKLFDFIIEKDNINAKEPVKNKTVQNLIRHEKNLKKIRDTLYEK